MFKLVCNMRQNIWNKVKKSSKIGQSWKVFKCTFMVFFTAIASFLLLFWRLEPDHDQDFRYQILDLTENFSFLDQVCTKKAYLVKSNESEQHHWICIFKVICNTLCKLNKFWDHPRPPIINYQFLFASIWGSVLAYFSVFLLFQYNATLSREKVPDWFLKRGLFQNFYKFYQKLSWSQ